MKKILLTFGIGLLGGGLAFGTLVGGSFWVQGKMTSLRTEGYQQALKEVVESASRFGYVTFPITGKDGKQNQLTLIIQAPGVSLDAKKK